MRISCPSCSTSYSIADDKVGAKGRSVRCASCGNKWHVALDQADDDWGGAPAGVSISEAATDDWGAVDADLSRDTVEDKIAKAPPVSIAAVKQAIDKRLEESTVLLDGSSSAASPTTDEAQTQIDLDAELAEINKRKDIESFAKKPKIKVSKKKAPKVRKPFKFDMDRFLVRARPVFGAMVLAMSIGVLGLAFALRTSIVAAFPSLASLYAMAGMPVNLRGLEIENLQMLREVENAQPVLVVEGELSNPGETDRDVPAIRFSLRGDDAQEIYAWSIEPKTLMLTPGASMRFRTRLASPPEQAADIQVRMIDRRNRQAALHE